MWNRGYISSLACSYAFPDDDNVTAKISVSRDYTIQFKPTFKGTSASSSCSRWMFDS